MVIFAMTHGQNLHLANCTFLAVDSSLTVFLAVVWFQALREMIDLLPGNHNKVLAAAINAICWLLFIVAFAWFVHARPSLLAVVSSFGAYLVAFSSMHAANISQKFYFSQHWLQSLIGIWLILVCLLILTFMLYFAKKTFFSDTAKRSTEKGVNDWAASTDEIESDFWAMPAAVAFTGFVKFLISTKFHFRALISSGRTKGNDLKAVVEEEGDDARHTNKERMMLLAWAVSLLVVGCVAIPFLKRLQRQDRPYRQQRIIGFACSFISLCIAWAFLDWGQWHVYEKLRDDPIFARIIFADFCTVIALLGVWALAMLRLRMCNVKLAIRALSLMVAWSWEQTFDATFEHEPHKWFAKLFVALSLGAILLPIMTIYIKPITLNIQEDYE